MRTYGLGALLYELVTGERLFAGSAASMGELERAVLELAAPLPSTRTRSTGDQSALRGDIDRIVAMALRKEPERRYQSAGQLADDVERQLAGRPVIAQPDRWSYRAQKFVQRNRVGVAIGLAFVGIVGAFAVREGRQAVRIAAERDRAVRAQEAGDEVLTFMTSLFQQSDPRVVPGGDTLRVGEFLALAERQSGSLADQPEQQMRVYRLLGDVRFSRGDYVAAESLLTVARDLGLKHFGPNHVEVLKTESLLAGVLRQRVGMPASRVIYQRVLDGLRLAMGQDHPDVAVAYSNLASSIDEPELIRTMLDSAIAIRSRIGRSDSVEIAGAFDQQASERGARGRFAEAVALDHASLRILETKFPKDHPYRLTVMGNLATWYGGLGRWDVALPIAEEVLKAARQQGSGGEGLALANERVALLQANVLGRQKTAEAGVREALRVFRATVAPEHVLISSSMRNLAIVLAAQGNANAGLTLLDSAIARERLLGRESGTSYMTGQRVPMLVQLGRVREAVESATTANAYRARLPKGSTRGADLSFWMGMAALADGRPVDATQHWSSAAEATNSFYPSGHPKGAMMRCALGVALAKLERVTEARALLSAACAASANWALFDPMVAEWGRREATRLGVQFAATVSR